jgi:hypothetical protein
MSKTIVVPAKPGTKLLKIAGDRPNRYLRPYDVLAYEVSVGERPVPITYEFVVDPDWPDFGIQHPDGSVVFWDDNELLLFRDSHELLEDIWSQDVKNLKLEAERREQLEKEVA